MNLIFKFQINIEHSNDELFITVTAKTSGQAFRKAVKYYENFMREKIATTKSLHYDLWYGVTIKMIPYDGSILAINNK